MIGQIRFTNVQVPDGTTDRVMALKNLSGRALVLPVEIPHEDDYSFSVWVKSDTIGSLAMLIALIVFMVIDYITGLMCAIADKKLSSAVGFKGICKKVLILILVGVAHILDTNVVGTGSALRGAVICFYLSNEGLSLLENAAHIGLPVPEKLKEILAQLHNREEKDKENDKADGHDAGGVTGEKGITEENISPTRDAFDEGEHHD